MVGLLYRSLFVQLLRSRISLLIITLFAFYNTSAQNVFSTLELDNNGPATPFELKWAIPLKQQGSVILKEEGKGAFTLVRYDEYFFEKWTVSLDFGKEGNHPQLYKQDGKVLLLRFWTEKNESFIDARQYDVETGELVYEVNRKLLSLPKSSTEPEVTLSSDRSKLLVYDFLSEDERNDVFEVYTLKDLSLVERFFIERVKTIGKQKRVHLNDNGNVFFVLGDPGSFTINAYFYEVDAEEPAMAKSVFSLQRPATTFKNITINQQSNTSYFVTTPAYIEEELVGINVSGFNVVLNNVLFSYTYNFDKTMADSLYASAEFTTQDQRKRHLAKPESFDRFYLQQCLVDNRADIICLLKEQDEPSAYHQTFNNNNAPIKWRNDDEKYYDAGDLVILSFGPGGTLQWKKLIQKFQESEGHKLNLSFISRIEDDTLKLITQESSKGPSFYYFEIDCENGATVRKESFIEKNHYCNKNYCTWIDKKTLLLSTYKQGGRKKAIHLVEF